MKGLGIPTEHLLILAMVRVDQFVFVFVVHEEYGAHSELSKFLET